MKIREHAAVTVNAAMTGFTLWAIGHLLRGPDARPSAARDFGAGALVVACLLIAGWASGEEQSRAIS